MYISRLDNIGALINLDGVTKVLQAVPQISERYANAPLTAWYLKFR